MAKSKPVPDDNPKNGPVPATPGTADVGPGEVLSLADAAAYLCVSAEDVLRMVRTQGLPGRQIDEEWRFLKGAIQRWLGCGPAKKGLLAHIGAAKDDPYLEEMLAEIYKRRGRPETEEG